MPGGGGRPSRGGRRSGPGCTGSPPACLDLLAKRRPEPATGGEVPWLQPYLDRLLDELPAGDADEPETVAVARETIELAYLVAVQHLAPRPRAVLILRDVLGWLAKDVAGSSGTPSTP